MSRSGDVQFGLGRSLLFSAILVSIFFVAAELVVRAYAYGFREPAERFDLEAGTFELVPGRHPRSGGRAPVIVNSLGFVGREFEEPRPPGTVRVVSVGDSCTFGDGGLDGHYPAMLERRLNETSDGVRYQVVNAGIEGLNSELALRRLTDKVVPLEPEIVTIYVGWNDLMKFNPAGHADQPRLAQVRRLLDRLWLVKGLRKLLFFYLRPRLAAPGTGPESRSGVFTGYTPNVFEANLREMVEAARAGGARVALLTLASVVDERMTERDLREANVIFPYFASAYGVGDLVDLIAAYNATIRAVAADTAVTLVDTARVLDTHPERRAIFLDTMHPNGRGLHLVANHLAKRLRESGLLAEARAQADARAAATAAR